MDTAFSNQYCLSPLPGSGGAEIITYTTLCDRVPIPSDRCARIVRVSCAYRARIKNSHKTRCHPQLYRGDRVQILKKSDVHNTLGAKSSQNVTYKSILYLNMPKTLCTKAFGPQLCPKHCVQKHLGSKSARNITYKSIWAPNLSETLRTKAFGPQTCTKHCVQNGLVHPRQHTFKSNWVTYIVFLRAHIVPLIGSL